MSNTTTRQQPLDDSFEPETIVRVHRHERDYVQIANATAQDKRLSWGARGLLIYLISLPLGWKIRVSHLVKQSGEGDGDGRGAGRDAVRKMLHELQSFGYASGVGRENQERSKRGRFGSTEIAVYETPALNPFFSQLEKTRNPASENTQSVVVSPSPENPSTVTPSPDSPSPENPSTYKEHSPQRTERKNHTHTNLRAVGAPAVVVGGNSKFSLEDCRRYADYLHSTGQGVNNPGGFARTIHKSGSEDEMIALFLAKLEPERVERGELPAPLDVSACPDCEGRRMRPVAGPGDYSMGVTKCKHESLKKQGVV